MIYSSKIKSGYSIDAFYYVYLGGYHIPYFGITVISGPRGGKYVLDEYGTERLLDRIAKVTKENLAKQGISIYYSEGMLIDYKQMRRALVGIDIIKYNCNGPKDLIKRANKVGYTVITRQQASKFADKIIGKLDFSIDTDRI